MKIAILGASGRTGSELTAQALAAGHEVVAYVRDPAEIKPQDGLTAVKGQIDEPEKLAEAIKDCDAVAVALGNPISDPSKPLFGIAIPNLITAAKKTGLKRIVVLSALGVGKTFDNTRYPYRFGARTFLRGNFKDHSDGESQLEGSGLNWTTIHPGPLANGPRTEHPTIADAATGYKMPRTPRTNRADVAATMLKVIDNPSTFGKQILLTSIQSTKN